MKKRLPATSPPPETAAAGADEARLRGATVLRALPILLIPVIVPLVVAALSWLLLSAGARQAIARPLPGRNIGHPFVSILVLTVFVSAVIILVRLGRPKISALVLVGMWTLVTTLLILRAGVSGFAPAVFLIPICAAGLLIDGAASVSLAALGTVLVVSLGWLEARGLGPVIGAAGPATELAPAMPYFATVTWIAVFWTVAGLTSLLAGGLQRALARSYAQARELRQLSEQLEQRVAVADAQLLQQEREAATLEERARLAREIHDTLAQGITGVVVQIGAAQQALRASRAVEGSEEERAEAVGELGGSLDLAQQMAREALAEARLSVWNLRSPALSSGDLADALRRLLARPLPNGVSGSLEQGGVPWPLSPPVESALLRIAQEAITNAARHAGATAIAVALEFMPESVRLSVRDNGSGFPEFLGRDGQSDGPWGGFGLLGMRERVHALGGTLELRSDDGALVLVSVPRAAQARQGGALPSVAGAEVVPGER